MTKIHFFSEKIDFSLPGPQQTTRWLVKSVASLNKNLTELNFIFTSDDNLLYINTLYLKHEALTDIITFDNSDSDEELEGDIFISVERVRENAAKYNTPFDEELHRVMIHGILHLAGYDDRSGEERKVMRNLENHYLALRNK